MARGAQPPRPLVLTQGDPEGVGPEIALKAWRELRAEGPPFILIGDIALMRRSARALALPEPKPADGLDPDDAAALFHHALPVLPCGEAAARLKRDRAGDPAHAPLIRASIDRAAALALSGEASGLVTNPISKAVMYRAGFDFPGHTEYVAALTAHAPWADARGPVMILAGGGLRTALATIHTPLRDAIAAITTDRIIEVAHVVNAALKRDFGLDKPRLALAGLNPHAGEGGALGREEIEIIAPAAQALRAQGVAITDPMPPDTLFHAEARAGYDAAICLYHDQGLIPVKTLDFHGGVNITLGLPVIRTSPDHGVAYDIAGTGQARPDSLIAALRQASAMAEQRARFAAAGAPA